MKEETLHRFIPLNSMQESILLAGLYEKNNSSYNIQVVVNLSEALDYRILKRAWNELQHQYEHFSLGVFSENLDQKHQHGLRFCENTQKAPLLDLDFSRYELDERKTFLKKFLQSDSEKPFKIHSPPLLRATIIKFDSNEFYFVVTFHHILFDGNSFLQLLTDLFNFYDFQKKGQPYHINKTCYPVFSQRLHLNESQKMYWEKLFSTFNPSKPISLSKRQMKHSSSRVSRIKTRLSAEDSRLLLHQAKKLAITPNIIFESILGILLSKFSYSEDIAYFSIRSIPRRNEAGVFINSFPIRCVISEAIEKFSDLITSIKQQHKWLKQYYLCSMREILRAANIDATEINVAVDYKSIDPLLFLKKYADKEAWKNREGFFHTNADYKLLVEITKVNDVFEIRLNYRNDVFEKNSISLFLDHYQNLLKLLASLGHEVDLKKLALCGESDLKKHRTRHYGRSLTHIFPHYLVAFYQKYLQFKKKVALTFNDTSYTYGQLYECKLSASNLLKQAGVIEESHVLLHLDRGADMVIMMLALAEVGASYTPTDVNTSPERLKNMIEDSGTKFILTSKIYEHKFSNHTQDTILQVERMNYKSNTDSKFSSYSGENKAYTIYTSGSTGMPKGVNISHEALLNFLLSMQSILEISEFDVFLAITSFSFDISGLEIYLPLVTGAKLILADNDAAKNPIAIMKMLQKEKITVLQATPSMWKLLLDAGWSNNGAIKVICGGEALSKEVAEKLLIDGFGFWHCYGPTETTIWSSLVFIDNLDQIDGFAPVGGPIFNTALYILDKQKSLLPSNITGEIYIGGEGLAQGYTNKKFTDEKFQVINIAGEETRLYKTGDLGHWREDGLIEFKGRIDDQIKLNGYRIELGEVESALNNLPSIKSAIVIYNEGQRKSLIAFVESDDKSQDIQDIKNKIGKILPDYMVPSLIYIIDKIPLNMSGKVDRALLKSKIPDLKNAPKIGKKLDVFNTLSGFFSNILGANIKTLNNDVDFFISGGDSLSALSLAAEIYKKYKIELTIREIYNHPSINELSNLIDHKLEQENHSQKYNSSFSTYTSAPLTDFQHRLWILNELSNDNAYNIAMIVKLEGEVNSDLLMKSFQSILKKHPGLLIEIKSIEDNLYQKVREKWDINSIFTIEFLNDAEDNIDEILLQKASNHFFNLTDDILLKVKLTYSSQKTCYLTLISHHLVLDEWSAKIILEELSRFYNSYITYGHLNEPDNQDEYLRNIHERFILSNSERASKLDLFWKKYLENHTHLSLPIDYAKPNIQGFDGDTTTTKVNSTLLKQISAFTQENKITKTAFMLSILNLLLYAYSSQEDIIIGIPSTLRNVDTNNVVGPFVNTLPLRNVIDPECCFASFTQIIKDNILAVTSHGDMPFEQMVEKLSASFSLNENPIFQIFFTFQKNFAELFNLNNVVASKVLTPKNKSKFNLSVYVIESNSELSIHMEYRTDLFKTSTIQRVSDCFLHIMNQVVCNKNLKISEIDFLTDKDKQLLTSWNKTENNIPNTTLVEIFNETAKNYSKKTAVIFEKQSICYEELLNQADSIANLLLAYKIPSKPFLIGIYLHKSIFLPGAILGSLKANAAYIPLDPAYPDDRVKYYIKHSGMTLIICNDDTVEKASAICRESESSVTLINLSTLKIPDTNNPPLRKISQNDIAYIVYTSGSTGKPKGVAITHLSLLNLLNAMKCLKLTDTDNFLSVTSISFDIFGLELFLPLLSGATLFIANKETASSPPKLKKYLSDEPITAMQATPITWSELLKVGWENEGSVKVICGGEALHKDLAARLLKSHVGFWHCYGPTETTIWSTCVFIDSLQHSHEWITIGSPIENTRIYVLNQQFKELPVGVEGNIYIAGAGLAKEYWKDSLKTNASFLVYCDRNALTDRIYKTGDKGFWNENGLLQYTGRMDHQIKLRGHRIEIGEIESSLRSHPEIDEAAVSLVEGDEPYLKAFVTTAKKTTKKLDFSLFFFPADDPDTNPYELYLEATTFADEHGFKAVWTPERHFNSVGGQFPNPTVLAAAISQRTKNIQIRAGSLVLPLHHPVRVAEDWSVIDNLSGGRVGIAFASGWHPQDFVLNETVYHDRKTNMREGVKLIQEIWSGKSFSSKDGLGNIRELTIFPKPIQNKLPSWVTAAGNPETFRLAGELGCNLFTHLLGQDLEDLSEKIQLYRDTLKENGYDAASRKVTLAIHTYLDESHENAVRLAKPFFRKYLKSHSELLRKFNVADDKINSLSEKEVAEAIEHSLDRFLASNSMIGSLENISVLLDQVVKIGVDEVACLIDFGLPMKSVISGIKLLPKLFDKKYNVFKLNPSSVKQYVSTQLPTYMLPKEIVEIERLPKTANNKIDRIALKSIKIEISKRKAKIEPKTDIEIKLLECISKLFKVNDIGVEVSLHDIGANSLLVVKLLHEIENMFHVKLNIQQMYSSENISMLASIISNNREHKHSLSKNFSPIVPLREGNLGHPLFLIHPIGGTVFCYRPLAKHIKQPVAIYGIQDPATITHDLMFSSIDEMVDYYLQAIHAFTSSEEIFLAGSSFGGTVALELASRLSEIKKKCIFVGLLDTWAIFPEDLKRKNYFEKNMQRQHEMLSSAFEDYNVENAKQWLELQWHRQVLLMNYRPKKIPLRNVILFKAKELLPEYQSINENSNYWSDYISGELKIETVPGNHETLLKEPNVKTLATKFDSDIIRILQSSKATESLEKLSRNFNESDTILT